MTFYFL